MASAYVLQAQEDGPFLQVLLAYYKGRYYGGSFSSLE
jgi:hypothetical protein